MNDRKKQGTNARFTYSEEAKKVMPMERVAAVKEEQVSCRQERVKLKLRTAEETKKGNRRTLKEKR
jgi:hypothetical protein